MSFTSSAEAERSGNDLGRWHTARDAARAVERLLAYSPNEMVRATRDGARAGSGPGCRRHRAGLRPSLALAAIEDELADGPYDLPFEPAYDYAFRKVGIDLAPMTAAEAASQFRSRSEAVRVKLAAAIDVWAARRRRRGNEGGARLLTEAANLIDSDLRRKQLRDVLQNASGANRLAKLRTFASVDGRTISRRRVCCY